MTDVFGFSALDRVYTASYSAENTQVTAFLSKRQSAEDFSGVAQQDHWTSGLNLREQGGKDSVLIANLF